LHHRLVRMERAVKRGGRQRGGRQRGGRLEGWETCVFGLFKTDPRFRGMTEGTHQAL